MKKNSVIEIKCPYCGKRVLCLGDDLYECNNCGIYAVYKRRQSTKANNRAEKNTKC